MYSCKNSVLFRKSLKVADVESLFHSLTEAIIKLAVKFNILKPEQNTNHSFLLVQIIFIINKITLTSKFIS